MYAQRSSPIRQSWEYKSIELARSSGTSEAWLEDARPLPGPVNILSKSKELGDQGWELVSVTPIPSYRDNSPPYSDNLLYFFKRPK